MNAQEKRLRAELRAESELITPGSLRPLDLRRMLAPASAHRRRGAAMAAGGYLAPYRAWLAPVAAAASVAVIAAAAGVLSHYAPAARREPGATRRPVAGQLQGIDALSARDAWAVGYLDVGQTRWSNMSEVPLIVHWNGRRWRRVAAPAEPGGRDRLNSIAGASPGNLWAVGVWGNGFHPIEPMIMHWNGRTWRLQRFADATKPGVLNAVAVLSATDAWAVGQTGGSDPTALILHWNGSTWNQVAAPRAASHQQQTLLSITAISADNAWAVGDSSQGPEIIHWNGASWTQVPDPDLNTAQPVLRSVEAGPAGAVWATGFTDGEHPTTLILRWTGTAWQQMADPHRGRADIVAAIAIVSPGNIWAAGSGFASQNTVILHRTGTTWTPITTRAATFRGGINDLAAISGSNIWAVGYRGTSASGVPQILHWNGSAWIRAYGPASTAGLYENSSCGPYCSGHHARRARPR